MGNHNATRNRNMGIKRIRIKPKNIKEQKKIKLTMAKPKRIGSGWHKQTVRHSRARKRGYAGGKYATKKRNITQREILFPIGQAIIPFNSFVMDTDKDGVNDYFDCEPFDRTKQGKKHEKPIKVKVTKKEVERAKNKLETDLQREIEKTKDTHKKEALKHIYKELREADTHTKIQRWTKDYAYSVSTLGIAIPFALISPLILAGVILGTGLTGDVPIRAFVPRLAVPLTSTVIGSEATRHSIKTIRAINKEKKKIYVETLQELRKDTKLPLKEAKKIAIRVAEQEISTKPISHELI